MNDSSAAAVLVARIHELIDELHEVGVVSCSDSELVEVAAENERAANRLMSLGNRQVVEISDRGLPRALGYRNLTALMDVRLRFSDVARRRRSVEATAEFTSPTGERLPARCPTLAEAGADGAVGGKHIDTVLGVLDRIPHSLAHDVKVAAERQMAELARVHTPKEIADLGAHLLARIDPDGQLTDEKDRARQRKLWLSHHQDPASMSVIKGKLDPMARARMRVFLEAWAAPGMNNPDDDASPHGAQADADQVRLAEAAGRDCRTQAQRNHDAMVALLAAVQDDGLLGKSHRGVPIQVIVKMTLSELKAEAGLATTMTGDLLPVPALVNHAAQKRLWLSVFEDASEVPLYFGRARRLASLGQRLASFSRTGGEVCSHPDCDQPAARVEMHHAAADFAKGGKTDITDLAPACGRHNRMVGEGPGKYTTGVEREGPDRGRCWWRVNASPGRPPNPKRFNQIADISGDLRTHVEQVRAEVYGGGCDSQSADLMDESAVGRAAEDDAIARYVDELAESWELADQPDSAELAGVVRGDVQTAFGPDEFGVFRRTQPGYRVELFTVLHLPGRSWVEESMHARLDAKGRSRIRCA